jgi:hypothetical protein
MFEPNTIAFQSLIVLVAPNFLGLSATRGKWIHVNPLPQCSMVLEYLQANFPQNSPVIYVNIHHGAYGIVISPQTRRSPHITMYICSWTGWWNPIKLLLNSKNPPFLVSGVLGSEAHTDARRLRCYPAIRTSSKCCGRALNRFCIAKHGDCTQEKWKLKLWNPDFIKNLGIFIITTISSRKRLNIANRSGDGSKPIMPIFFWENKHP